jgi:hypothetical protein
MFGLFDLNPGEWEHESPSSPAKPVSPSRRPILLAARWVAGATLGSASVYAGTRLFRYVYPVFESVSQTLKGASMPAQDLLSDPMVFDSVRYSIVGVLALAMTALTSLTFRKAVTSPLIRQARDSGDRKTTKLTSQQQATANLIREAITPLVGTLQPAMLSVGQSFVPAGNPAIKAGDVVEVIHKDALGASSPVENRPLRQGDRFVVLKVQLLQNGDTELRFRNFAGCENVYYASAVRKVA